MDRVVCWTLLYPAPMHSLSLSTGSWSPLRSSLSSSAVYLLSAVVMASEANWLPRSPVSRLLMPQLSTKCLIYVRYSWVSSPVVSLNCSVSSWIFLWTRTVRDCRSDDS